MANADATWEWAKKVKALTYGTAGNKDKTTNLTTALKAAWAAAVGAAPTKQFDLTTVYRDS